MNIGGGMAGIIVICKSLLGRLFLVVCHDFAKWIDLLLTLSRSS